MKPSYEWDETDLQSLITSQRQENVTLDYKACPALDKTDGKKNEISKDVSAFANSAGGTLVYGMIEQGHLPTAIDDGYDPSVISKEWLEQVISSRIQRRIDGIIVNPVALSGAKAGRYAYVVYIPQSLRAPHMASDHRYYKRTNTQVLAMEDYEVRDVARRAETPDLRLLLRMPGNQPTVLTFNSGATESVAVPLYFRIVNESNAVVQHAIFTIFFDSRLIITSHGDMTLTPGFALELGDMPRVIANRLQKVWTVGLVPIWRGINVTLEDDPVMVAFPRTAATYTILWRTDAPGMEYRQQRIQLRSNAYTVEVEERGSAS